MVKRRLSPLIGTQGFCISYDQTLSFTVQGISAEAADAIDGASIEWIRLATLFISVPSLSLIIEATQFQQNSGTRECEK